MGATTHADDGAKTDELKKGMRVQLGPWKTDIAKVHEDGVEVVGDVGGIMCNYIHLTKEYARAHLID